MPDRVMQRVRGAKLTEDEITDRISKAKELHATRNKMMRDVMDKYERRYASSQKDVADTETPLVKSPRGQGIIDVMFSLLTTEAELGTQVLPLKAGQQEDKLCSTLERGLEGLQYEIESSTGRVPYWECIHWFLVKGWGVLKTGYYPQLECPIYVEALDPETVYPMQETKLLWVVEERKRYWGEVRKQMERMKGLREGKRSLSTWRIPTLAGRKTDDKVTLTEYWDEDWSALKVEDEFVYNRPNHLGFIPYVFAKCRHTPSADPAWAGQSILAPILGLLELETEIYSKFGTSVDLFFYPYILVQDPDGRTAVLHGIPGVLEHISYESKVTVMQPQSNIREAQELLGQAQSLINIMTLPTVMFGEPPGQVQAGYPMSLLMNAAKTRLNRESGQIEWALAQQQGQVLRTIEKFGGLSGGVPVYVGVEGSRRGQKALLTLTDKDVAGHYRCSVVLAPKLPPDWMQLAVISERLRRENKMGEPLLSDDTIRELLFELQKPEEEVDRLLEQKMMMHPDVANYTQEKYLKEWRKREGIKTPEELMERAMPLVPPRGLTGQQRPGGMGLGLPPSQAMPPAMAGVPPRSPIMPGEEMPEDLMRQMMGR